MAHHVKGAAVCTFPYCKKLDFLPFICGYCNEKFCLDHFKPEVHECRLASHCDRKVFSCPLCLQTILIIPTEPPDLTWQSHYDSDCKRQELYQQRRKPTCPVKGCREKLTLTGSFNCKKCGQCVCLKHRFQDAHECIIMKSNNGNFPEQKGSGAKTPLGALWRRISKPFQ